MTGKGPIFLITGVPGVGKSSVSAALMRRFPFGLHLPIDDLREWVVSGIAHPGLVWTEEMDRQFSIARRAAVETVRIYAGEGFAVAIDDVLLPAEGQALFVDRMQGYVVHMVFLWAELDVNQLRNRDRTNKTYDTSGLIEMIGSIHGRLDPAEFEQAGWLVVNSTHLSLDETVDAILEGQGMKREHDE